MGAVSSPSFKDQSWDQRFQKMGDQAEGHFEQYATEVLKLGYIRFGLDRPPLKMSMLPTRLRYTPDYLMSNMFVEVQGCGRDQLFKLKLEKLNCLHYWQNLHPTHLYLWDSHNKRECMVHLFDLDALINAGKTTLAAFPEGKAYFEIKADDVFEVAASHAA